MKINLMTLSKMNVTLQDDTV